MRDTGCLFEHVSADASITGIAGSEEMCYKYDLVVVMLGEFDIELSDEEWSSALSILLKLTRSRHTRQEASTASAAAVAVAARNSQESQYDAILLMPPTKRRNVGNADDAYDDAHADANGASSSRQSSSQSRQELEHTVRTQSKLISNMQLSSAKKDARITCLVANHRGLTQKLRRSTAYAESLEKKIKELEKGDKLDLKRVGKAKHDSWSWLTPQGMISLGLRRNMSNIATADIGHIRPIRPVP